MTLREIIETQYEHPNYPICQEIVNDALLIHTQDREKHRSELKRYRSGETEEEINQRIRLHNPILAAIIQPTYSYLSYIYRTDGIKRIHRTDDSDKKDLIEKNFERFYGEQSLHEYVYEAIVYYNKVDPNTWIGFDRKNIINDSGGVDAVQVYPVEFPSSQVVAFDKDENGRTLSLTARRTFDAVGDDGKKVKDLRSYFHYFPGGWQVAYEIGDGGATHPNVDTTAFEQVTYTINDTPTQFWYNEGLNDTEEVPFACVGAEWHPEHRNEVYCTFTHEATGLLKSILRDNNFLAVQKSAHIFPEKSEYVKPCTHTNEQGEACYGGYYGGKKDQDHLCKACNGHGYIVTQTEQRVKRLKMPERADEMLELSKLTHYHERPLNIAEFYVKEEKRLSDLVFSTTYNQNNTAPSPQAKTATEVVINRDLINNKLTPIAGRIEDVWELAHRIAHQYYSITDGDVEMTHPADFKTATVDELIKQYNDALQLPSAVRNSITHDILNKQYRNFPQVKEDIVAFESWKPWKDKTPEETVIIISTRSEEDFYRQLWENWEMVVQQAKYNVSGGSMEPKFYLLSRDFQLREMQKALTQVMELAQYVQPVQPDNIFPLGEVA